MDDFSFPAIQTDQDSACNLPFPHFASSPLWFLSCESDAKPLAYRRSFSSVTGAVKVADALNVSALSDDEGGRGKLVSNEEKMDMLWEDFNEDLYRFSCELKDSKGKPGLIARGSSMDFCVLKRASSLLPRRKPGLAMMLKMLKKMFLIQQNGSAKRAVICKKKF